MPSANGIGASIDPLEADNYNPLDHVNAIFSHRSKLAAIGSVSDTLRTYRHDLAADLAEREADQAASDTRSVERIRATQAELAALFAKIDGVHERAMQTERAITEMTADIKRLDGTKRNLALSMTALKRLQMLTTAYEQLRGLARSRQYRDCAQLLPAVVQLMAHFKSYRSIDQIATLSRDVADLQRALQEQVTDDFEMAFAKAEVAPRRAALAAACLVVDALGDNARARLVNWYCNTQLREYRQIFRGNSEAGSLDNISRRYSWFKRMWKTYEEEHAALFPVAWKVNETLVNSFCDGTREDYKAMLSRSMRRVDGQGLDVNLLLACLQETLDFEQYLEQRLASESRASIDTFASNEKTAGPSRAISEAFEPYLSLWIDAQDRQLAELVARYRQQPLRPPDDDLTPQSVVTSSIELFHAYRVSLAQCAKLSTGSKLLELSQTFAKYLSRYAEQVLLERVADASGACKEAAVDAIILVLNTADYCHTTSGQLEAKIKSRVDVELQGRVELQPARDAFIGVASAAIRCLVRTVDRDCEPAWREMRNVPWSKLATVGDQSGYVAELLQRVRARTAEIRRWLHKAQYARAFCDNLVEWLANTYLANVLLCRPISETGAEQMLLDLYVLKQGFEGLMTLNAAPGTPAPASYVKRVAQSINKLDPLLKTLQVRSSPPEGLVQAYLIHIGDRSDANFRKVLDLKGIRKNSEQAALVELFHAHLSSSSSLSGLSSGTPLVAQSPLLTNIHLGAFSSLSSSAGIGAAALLGGGPGGGGGGGGGSNSGSGSPNLPVGASAAGSGGGGGASSFFSLSAAAPSLQGHFNPASLGSAIVSAARDGVDRLGHSVGGGGGGAPVPLPAAASLSSPLAVLAGRRTHHAGSATSSPSVPNSTFAASSTAASSTTTMPRVRTTSATHADADASVRPGSPDSKATAAPSPPPPTAASAGANLNDNLKNLLGRRWFGGKRGSASGSGAGSGSGVSGSVGGGSEGGGGGGGSGGG
ncbi:MAG: Vacuolar protein sorting-associated protein 53 [Phylliscum demangeonii]|nr:MAG: Vacuolar protein sorting-associated protein 53 [Phylliscum demangeonii]